MILLMTVETIFLLGVVVSVGNRWGSDIGLQLAGVFALLVVPLWVVWAVAS